MPGPGAYWFGEEETEAIMEVMEGGYLFRYGSENDPKFLHKVSDPGKKICKILRVNVFIGNFFRNIIITCIGNCFGTETRR